MNTTISKVRCAIYCRVSSDAQAAPEHGSMERQVDRCNILIRNDLADNSTVTIFNEPAISGDSIEKREVLKLLLKQVEAGLFDRVYVSTLCRLTRDAMDGLHIITKVFKAANVILVTGDRGIINPDDQSSFIPMAMNLVINQGELENIKHRVRAGIYSRATEGKGNGRNSYGYVYANEELVINEAEATIVREIYTRYDKGELLHEIVAEFRRRELRTRIRTTTINGVKTSIDGTYFTESKLLRILSNCIYNGYIRTTLHKKLKSVSVVPIYEENGYAYFKAVHTPIIDEILWNRVKLRLLKARQTPHRSRAIKYDEYLLRHLLRCGCCNMGFSSTYSLKYEGATRRFRYYLCQRVNEDSRYTGCNIRRIPSEVFENVILDVLSALGNDPDIVDAMLAQAKTMNSRYHDDGKVRLAELHEQLTKTQLQIKRLVGAIRSGEASPIADEIKKEIEHLGNQRKALEQEMAGLRALQEKSAQLPANKDAIVNRLHEYSTAIQKLPDLKKHELLRLIFKRITVCRMSRPFHGSTPNASENTRYFRLICKLYLNLNFSQDVDKSAAPAKKEGEATDLIIEFEQFHGCRNKTYRIISPVMDRSIGGRDDTQDGGVSAKVIKMPTRPIAKALEWKRRLDTDPSLTQTGIAQGCGYTTALVSYHLGLLKLHPDIIEALQHTQSIEAMRHFSLRHLLRLVKEPQEKQLETFTKEFQRIVRTS